MIPSAVGFVGLGKIGYAMASNIIKAGVCRSAYATYAPTQLTLWTAGCSPQSI